MSLRGSSKNLKAALGAPDGELGTVRFDPGNDAEGPRPSERVEQIVDNRLARFLQNPLVRDIAEQAKQHFRKQIVTSTVGARPLLEDNGDAAASVDPEGCPEIRGNPKVF